MTGEKNDSVMAVNKRLYDVGLLDKFYRAATMKDRDKMIVLLMSVELDRTRAEATADNLLKDQAFSES